MINIADNNIASAKGNGSVEALYREISGWRDCLAAVRAGEHEFLELLEKLGLVQFGLSTSAVHPDSDVEVHAFILAIVSGNRRSEIQTKSFLTYAAHWIDDFFDSPESPVSFEQLSRDRSDIRAALVNMGAVGQVGLAMAGRVPHPSGVFRALHRMLYGGLVQRSRSRVERLGLVKEYMELATRELEPKLCQQIRRLQPQAYWTTNKTVLEFSYAAETVLNLNVAELWNLLYAPALYYQDADEERVRGELTFEVEEEPALDELISMVRLGAWQLAKQGWMTGLELEELRFAALSFRNLPRELAGEYRLLCGARSESRGVRLV